MRLYKEIPTASRLKLFEKRCSISTEDGELLHALVRITKPEICIETGCYNGDSSHWIARALAENGFGHLHTCDVMPERTAQARNTLLNLPATVYDCPGIELLDQFPVMDFVFIDSGDPNVRRAELMMLGDKNISPLGIVSWHDAASEEQIENARLLYDAFAPAHNWAHLLLPSLVGMAIFQRPQE